MKLRVMSYELRVCRGVWQYALTKRFRILGLVVLLLVTCHLPLVTAAFAATWGGVDESVVEKYAEEHGRAPREPFINTDQGDLLLFMFLAGGAAAGFAAGYYWRSLTDGKARNRAGEEKANDSV